MHAPQIATRILLTLGLSSALVGCGSSSSTSSEPVDAEANDGAIDGKGESGVDTAVDVVVDSGRDADAVAETFPCPRRPFLVGAEPRAGGAVVRSDWSKRLKAHDSSIDPHTARLLSAAWLDDARHEHASIAAFARFTMLALAVGAPPEVIEGSQRASLDEVGHARDCFALAHRYGGVQHGPGALSLEGALHPLSLAELAALTVHEGCVGETIGVFVAAEQRRIARDPEVGAILERLVRDEMRHAELAWSFVRWAIAQGGASVRAAVRRAFEQAAEATTSMSGVDDPRLDVATWNAHGRLTASETKSIVARGLREIVGPCARALLADRDARPEVTKQR